MIIDNYKKKTGCMEKKPLIGLALGCGSARGWAHIGILNTLNEIGIFPDILCGCSSGAIVGGAYATGHLKKLEAWAKSLNWKELLSYADININRGGVIIGDKLYNFFEESAGDINIEKLPIRFATVATDLSTGKEVWFTKGSLLDAVRASVSLPGLLAPFKFNDSWLVDGGLVNPVPVSLCRALGADIVIAVNLNGTILGKHCLAPDNTTDNENSTVVFLDNNDDKNSRIVNRFSKRLKSSIKKSMDSLVSKVWHGFNKTPGLIDVLASSVNIMQDRITKSRLKQDPPDFILTPKTGHLGLMEFNRASEAIKEGVCCVRENEAILKKLFCKKD